jgi:hypothetical protein
MYTAYIMLNSIFALSSNSIIIAIIMMHCMITLDAIIKKIYLRQIL